MGYKLPATITLDLPADIADGLWIKIRNPKMIPWSTMKQFLKMASAPGDSGSMRFDPDAAQDLATSMIVDWNLPSMDGDGMILSIPSKDPSSWEKVPSSAIVTLVLQAMGRPENQPAPDPN
jgi:hypothetical protein